MPTIFAAALFLYCTSTLPTSLNWQFRPGSIVVTSNTAISTDTAECRTEEFAGWESRLLITETNVIGSPAATPPPN